LIQFRYHYDDNGFSKKLSFFLQYRFDIVTASPQLLRRYHHDIYLKEYLIDTVSISLWWRWFFKKIKFFLQYRFGIVTASSQLLQRYYHDIYLKNTVSISLWWRWFLKKKLNFLTISIWYRHCITTMSLSEFLYILFIFAFFLKNWYIRKMIHFTFLVIPY